MLLKQAVFKFGSAEEGSACDLYQEPRPQVPEDQLVKIAATPFPLAILRKILQQKSGARKVEINCDACSFSFHYDDGFLEAKPWELLDKIPKPDPWGTSHFHSTTLPVYPTVAKHTGLIRAATNLVWNQSMVPAFNRAVSTGAVALYARPQITSFHYEQIPAYAWPLLDVVDWENGVAMAVDHTSFWLIHAGHATSAESSEQGTAETGMRENKTVSTLHLKEAPRATIHEAITAAYDEAHALDQKPPNIKELATAVLPLLEARGYRASRNLIMQLGSAPQHVVRRRRRGQKLFRQRRAPVS